MGGAKGQGLVAWKVLLLLVDFFVAFFCFSIAVDFFRRVGYMVTVPPEQQPAGLGAALAKAYLDRAGLYYLLGLRAFFYAVPLIFWIFGPLFMIAGTLILIVALYLLDRAPAPRLRTVTHVTSTERADSSGSPRRDSPIVTTRDNKAGG